MKTKFKFFCAFLAVTVAVLNVCSFAAACKNIRHDVLRLHILAESDSDYDQGLKLLVRDAVLEMGGDLFNGTVTAQQAQSIITPRLDEIKAVAEKTLRDNGCDYSVEVTVADEFFNTRCYEDFTMPAGVYTALKIKIGSACGRNWWCVMFPPLCLPAATVDADAFFTDDEMQVISSSPKYEVRFKVVEIYEKIKYRLNGG